MKNKIKNFSKKYLIGFVISGILSVSISVYAVVTFPSNDVTYDNSSSGLKSTNVKEAIDELYNLCK